MTHISQTTTKSKPEISGIGATKSITVEQYAADTPTSLITKNLNDLPKTFIRNAQLACDDQTHAVAITLSQIFVLVIHNPSLLQPTPRQWLEKRKKWHDSEYRQSYMEAAIEQGVAWQIKINREHRSLSQKELALRIGSAQSAISRAEDPSYGRHRLETLVKVANAFDCALQVKFIPYSQLAKDSDDLSPNALYAKSYIEEIAP